MFLWDKNRCIRNEVEVGCNFTRDMIVKLIVECNHYLNVPSNFFFLSAFNSSFRNVKQTLDEKLILLYSILFNNECDFTYKDIRCVPLCSINV